MYTNTRHRPVTQAEIDAFIDAMPIVIIARAIRQAFRAAQRALGVGRRLVLKTG